MATHSINPSEQPSDDQSPLIPLSEFRKSGRAPIEMYHCIFHHRDSLVEAGAIVKYGAKWLVSEPHLYQWLRKNGRSNP